MIQKTLSGILDLALITPTNFTNTRTNRRQQMLYSCVAKHMRKKT